MPKRFRPSHTCDAQFLRLHKRHPGLVDDHTTRAEHPSTIPVELLRKQDLSCTDRIRAVHNDHVKRTVRRLGNVPYAITDNDIGAAIVPCVAANLWKQFSREPYDRSVDLNHHRMLDCGVLKHAPQNATIPRADDQYTTCCAMSQQWNMRNHLLVNELICLGYLHVTVK